MSRSTAQFNVRPGVGGVPPIVPQRNTRWFNTRLLTDGTDYTVAVEKGIVYCPVTYDRNVAEYAAPMETHEVAAVTLTLTTAAEQCIVVRVPFVAGHGNTSGDPLYGLFDASLQNNEDFSTPVGHEVTATDGTTTLYGVTHKALWLELDTVPSVLRVNAADVASTDVILAEITYVDGNYELFPRHDGAIFVFPPVWVTNHTYNW